MIRAAAVALALCAGPALAQDDRCSAGIATYTLSSDPTATVAQLRVLPLEHPTSSSGSYLQLWDGATDRSFDFGIVASNGYGTVFAQPRDAALGDGVAVYAFHDDGEGRLVPPPEGEAPLERLPRALFLSEIGSRLWYATNGDAASVGLPTELWYFFGCME